MKCPNCQNETESISLTDKLGTPLEIDRCPNCHGFWVDSEEIGRLKFQDAIKIDPAKNPEPAIGGSRCPRCQSFLAEFREFKKQDVAPYLFYNCHSCGGTFFPAGNLAEYKKHSEGKIEPETKEFSIQKQLQAALLIGLIFIFSLSLILVSTSGLSKIEAAGFSNIGSTLIWKDYLLLILALIIFVLGGTVILRKNKQFIGWLSIFIALTIMIYWLIFL